MQPFANTESLNDHHVKADREICTGFVISTDIFPISDKVKGMFRAATTNFFLIHKEDGVYVKNTSNDLMLHICAQFWQKDLLPRNTILDGLGGPLVCTLLCRMINPSGQRISTLQPKKMAAAGLPLNRPILVVTSDPDPRDGDGDLNVYSYALNNRHMPINKIIETCNLYDPTRGLFTSVFVGVIDFYLSYMYLKELIRIKNGN